MTGNLFDCARRCLDCRDPDEKIALTMRAFIALLAGELDVTPGMIERLNKVGDSATVVILEIILHDEIGHVKIGTRWFYHLCGQRQLDPEQTFVELLETCMPGQVRPPFHYEARRRAGFSDSEMHHLERMAKKDG